MALRDEQSSVQRGKELSQQDYEHWLHMPYWWADEGLALMFGKDPEALDWKVLRHLEGYSEFVDNFARARERFFQDRRAGIIPFFLPPHLFIAWATDAGFDLPAPLRRFARRTAELRNYLRQLDARHVSNEAPSRGQHHSDRGQSESPSRFSDDRTAGNLSEPSGAPFLESSSRAMHVELSTKERATVLKIILGMAVVGYRYNPKASRTSVTKEIADDIHSVGLTIDEDTVRKYLRAAAEMHLPGELPSE
jgi:hypothetical protein